MAITAGVMVLAACAVPVVLVLARSGRGRRDGALQPEASVLLDWDDTRIRVRYPEGRVVTVRWENLLSVCLRTTDEGPWRPDVFWWMTDLDGVVLIAPQGATGEDGFLAALERRLPGFDDRAVIAAMGSTDNAVFTLWQRTAKEQGTAAPPAAR